MDKSVFKTMSKHVFNFYLVIIVLWARLRAEYGVSLFMCQASRRPPPLAPGQNGQSFFSVKPILNSYVGCLSATYFAAFSMANWLRFMGNKDMVPDVFPNHAHNGILALQCWPASNFLLTVAYYTNWTRELVSTCATIYPEYPTF